MIRAICGVSLIFFSGAVMASARTASEVMIPSGVYKPFFRDKDEKDKLIGPLWVDRYLVSNEDFRKFLKSHPELSRSRIPRAFASTDYLANWKSDDRHSDEIASHPVVNVSWFVARKYCKSLGKRLMTVAEWEYVSDAENSVNLQRILEWYGETSSELTPVTKANVNARGVAGMHGLVWEWVEDFSSVIMEGDSRSSNETSAAMFCGSGSLKAKDPSQYATFMRFAHRSSLRADSVGRTLGFRCARDISAKTNNRSSL